MTTPTDMDRSSEASTGNPMQWLLPLIALLLLSYLGYKFLLEPDEELVAVQPTPSAVDSNTASQSENRAQLDAVTSAIAMRFEQLLQSLEQVRDAESARAVIPSIQSVAKLYSELQIDPLPPIDKERVSATLGRFATEFENAQEKLYALPDVKTLLEPELKPLVNGLQNLNKR